MIIDAYSHFSFIEILDLMETESQSAPHIFRPLFEKIPTLIDVQARIELMGNLGIDQSVLVPLPWLETTPAVYHNPEKCDRVARRFNDLLAQLISQHAHLFIGVALLPTVSPDMMVEELERAVTELNFGGGLIVVGPTVKPSDHPDYEFLYQKAVELNVPIWLHPSRPPHYPDYEGEDVSRFQIWQTLSWLQDTSAAMVRIVFSNVFERYPNLKLIVHHHGALIPLFSQRMQYSWDFFEQNLNRKQPTLISQPYIDHFKKFYCDTATQGYEPKILEAAHTFFGNDKLLFGSDAPMDQLSGQIFTQMARKSVENMTISDLEKQNIFSTNINQLLPHL